jgi:hypothetical protein
MPERIQRRRTKGYRMPPGAKYVGRPTRWANWFAVVETQTGWAASWSAGPGPRPAEYYRRAESRHEAHRHAVDMYAAWVLTVSGLVEAIRAELAGRDLMCWCPLGLPCHADVLLDIANPEESGRG